MAVVISVLWLSGVAALLVAFGGDAAFWLAVAVAVALPLALIWFAALLYRQSALLHDELARLARASDAAREAASAPHPGPTRPMPAAQPAAPSPPPRQPRPMKLTQSAEQPPAPPPQPTAQPVAELADARRGQANLPLDVAADEAAVSLATLIRALEFPSSAEDKEGFRALHRALRDPRARRLVQASQDVLTLLGEEGIYMDDLPPARARPELWRRFAKGERGTEVGKVGGIRDRSSLALTAARLRADPVFRDAAHHFLRLFDQTLASIAPEATDAELAALADTRTARAFMLVGRVAGIFE